MSSHSEKNLFEHVLTLAKIAAAVAAALAFFRYATADPHEPRYRIIDSSSIETVMRYNTQTGAAEVLMGSVTDETEWVRVGKTGEERLNDALNDAFDEAFGEE